MACLQPSLRLLLLTAAITVYILYRRIKLDIAKLESCAHRTGKEDKVMRSTQICNAMDTCDYADTTSTVQQVTLDMK